MSAPRSDGPPPPYQPPGGPPQRPPELPEMTSIELACTLACGFYSLLAVVSQDRMSQDGQREALAMADCMLACQERFGSGKRPCSRKN